MTANITTEAILACVEEVLDCYDNLEDLPFYKDLPFITTDAIIDVIDEAEGNIPKRANNS